MNESMFDVLVVGCGLCGMTVARELAERDKKVHIIDKRGHIGGNIYDYYNFNGVLIQKYGPHVFFTDKEEIIEYIKRYVSVYEFRPECRTYINGVPIPIPFNFLSIDIIYKDKIFANKLKRELVEEFGKDAIVSVVDLIESDIPDIKNYGLFMYEYEYKKYTAKQWNLPIEKIDKSVFLRVPVYISEKKEYMRQTYQYMPEKGFSDFANNMINHANISIELNSDARDVLAIDCIQKVVTTKYPGFKGPVVYTGPLDELFLYENGRLPYRSLEFTWKVISKKLAPPTPLTVYPESDKYIRITDYTQFPPQDFGDKAVIAIEYPLEYRPDELCGTEPYYPVLNKESREIYSKYKKQAESIKNLYVGGRLSDFKYYNMDAVIERGIELSKNVLEGKRDGK